MSIENWGKGNNFPQARNARKLENLLGVPIEAIMAQEKEPDPTMLSSRAQAKPTTAPHHKLP